MEKGKIGVTTENIFPIIKKFLYSDHEIFLRELISNAVDATQKLKTLANTGEFKGELGDLTVRVDLDKKKGTLTITDQGIGMSEAEVKKYINQIALSSAEDFLEKYKNQSNAIIGHFGLGFYSAFMVSKKVEVITKSYIETEKAVKWECDGSPEYSLEDTNKETRGTQIILHIDKDSKEFLEENKINQLLNKYCKFLPVEIGFGKQKEWKDGKEVELDKDKIINNPNPLWTQKPADLKDEDYGKFYNELYPMGEEPLFNIHLNVDYPFNLTGILYFPKIKNNIDIQRNKIQLYCNQVFVTDSVEGIVPEFLTLLHGIIDSPDIPLNVSRSYLQSDSNVKKISSHITKKVADRLAEIFKNDREQFEKKWDNLKLFIEYGMVSEEKFYEKAQKFALLKNTEGKYFTFEEYEKLIKENQTDKNKNLVYLYTSDKDAQYSFIDAARSKGYDVLIMDGQLDTHYINHLEQKFKDSRFVRVDADVADKLIEKEENKEIKLSSEQRERLTPVFRGQLPDKANFIVQFEGLSETESPLVITQSEFMRRMKDMSALGGGMNFYGELPDSYNLVINGNHPLILKINEDLEKKSLDEILKIEEKIKPLESNKADLEKANKDKKDEEVKQEDKDRIQDLEKKIKEFKDKKQEVLNKFGKKNKQVKQLIDLALLANNMLKGEELSKFVKRSIELL
ncbi:MAG: molecular chaperone HtpG [Bacteroidales bacterium]|nr:molecular chaperone HtpG [Bacteroidales bacterium]MBN2819814.1 molecular chaperone HtpG [Bacteroidales bacterium]